MSHVGSVIFTHCVDAEGPLYEGPGVAEQLFAQSYGISDFQPDKVGDESDPSLAAKWIEHQSRRKFMADWTSLDEMMEELMSSQWRESHCDDWGGNYVFSWFILDHVGFCSNPRRRALGYHVIYDYFRCWLQTRSQPKDRLYWHFHPVSWSGAANESASTLSSSLEHIEILTRRLLERNDFPVAFRPGQHTERPDFNLFLEQWIPFDFGNQGMDERVEDAEQTDISGGRFGDWRRAPQSWGVYHPSIWDYQIPGELNRYIARCLNLDARLRPVNFEEVERAFLQADEGSNVLLSVTNHDEREMRPAIAWLMQIIIEMRRKYPRVAFRFANAVEGIRAAAGLERPTRDLELHVRWRGANASKLEVVSSEPLWGNQPFLAIRSGDRFIHENFDYHGGCSWSYTFDEYSIPRNQIDRVAVGAHSLCGNSVVSWQEGDAKQSFEFRKLNHHDWLEDLPGS